MEKYVFNHDFNEQEKRISFNLYSSSITGRITEICREYVEFKDTKIKEALIKAGWTPPKEKLKSIPFIHPNDKGFKEVYETLVDCWSKGFLYTQVADILRNKGYYLPNDQWRAFKKLLNVDFYLNTGTRQQELENA